MSSLAQPDRPVHGSTPMTAGPTPAGSTGSTGSTVLAEFHDYSAAQRLVAQLSDAGFPVQHLRIIGTGLRSVEQVTGRVTKGKAALAGAASGAWFGLLIGLLFGLFAVVGWFGVVLTSVLLGALFGATLGFAAHAATGGARDFASIRTMQAERYEVQVDADHAAEAQRVAARF